MKQDKTKMDAFVDVYICMKVRKYWLQKLILYHQGICHNCFEAHTYIQYTTYLWICAHVCPNTVCNNKDTLTASGYNSTEHAPDTPHSTGGAVNTWTTAGVLQTRRRQISLSYDSAIAKSIACPVTNLCFSVINTLQECIQQKLVHRLYSRYHCRIIVHACEHRVNLFNGHIGISLDC